MPGITSQSIPAAANARASSPPEYEWVAAFQAADDLTGAGSLDKEQTDFLLRNGALAATLAGVNEFGTAAAMTEDFGIYEMVIYDHVAGAQGTGCFQGQ